MKFLEYLNEYKIDKLSNYVESKGDTVWIYMQKNIWWLDPKGNVYKNNEFITRIPLSKEADFGYLHFDYSWDWLMPVIIKIGKDHYEEDRSILEYFEYLRKRYLYLYPKTTEWNVFETLEDVFIHVIEVIKWYNKQSNDKR